MEPFPRDLWQDGLSSQRQGRDANAVACTHLPAGREPGSRELVLPAHGPVPASTGIPVLGFNRGSTASELPRARPRGGEGVGITAPLTTKDSLFLQHHLASIKLEEKERPSGPRQAPSVQAKI